MGGNRTQSSMEGTVHTGTCCEKYTQKIGGNSTHSQLEGTVLTENWGE
jgi:hypothetical protein